MCIENASGEASVTLQDKAVAEKNSAELGGLVRCGDGGVMNAP